MNLVWQFVNDSHNHMGQICALRGCHEICEFNHIRTLSRKYRPLTNTYRFDEEKLWKKKL